MAQTRLAVLDGLRGIAVLLVLWYHIWEISWLPAPALWLQFVPETGFTGVDLFFFISGFVIVYPFVKAALHDDIAPGWGHFAYRRALKIVPSYLLSIVIVIAIGYARFPSARDAFADIVTHLLFIHTWFATTYGSINGVLWTLAVEVEFYALFPLLWPLFKRWPYATAAAMTIFSLAYRHYEAACCLQTSAPQLIENLPGYLDTFAAGMVGAHLYVRLRERADSKRWEIGATAIAFAGFALLAYELQGLWVVRALPDWPTFWKIDHRTIVAFAFLCMGLGSLLAVSQWQRLLSNRVLLFFGIISYNLYLYHQPLARLLLQWRIPPFHGTDQHFDATWKWQYTVVAFILTVLQAALFTYAFERPLLRLRRPRALNDA